MKPAHLIEQAQADAIKLEAETVEAGLVSERARKAMQVAEIGLGLLAGMILAFCWLVAS